MDIQELLANQCSSETEGEHGFDVPDDWDGIPRVYIHSGCGSATQMPENVINNYLADPNFYFMPGTICCECGQVPESTCHWTETGQRLDEYMAGLKKKKEIGYHCVRWLMPVFFAILGAYFFVVDPFNHFANAKGNGNMGIVWGAVCGLGVSFFVGRFIRLAMCKMKLI